jgi:hypothetical protein
MQGYKLEDIILGTALYFQDFEECQQYLSTLVSTTSTQAKNNCHIGAANHTDHDDDDDEPPKKRFKKKVHTKKGTKDGDNCNHSQTGPTPTMNGKQWATKKRLR